MTYDDAQSVCNKAEYVNSKLLGGLFVWELSGDLLDTLATPLLDALNRKLEEINFDCTKLRVEEDCSQVELPPPAAKGSAQVQVEVEGDIINMTELILDHLEKAEAGELASRGYGALTREVFMMRAYDGSFFPSYTYRYDHFVDALAIMSVTGVSGETFFMGYGENGQNGRQLQADNSTDKSTSLVYGLVNIAAFLAQAMTESIIHDACDELNVQPLPNSTDDGIGLDDGHDHFRFPISNACGQNGRSYQDEQCKLPEDSIYDCANQLNSEEFASVEVTAVSRSRWPGAPGPFYCGPKSSEVSKPTNICCAGDSNAYWYSLITFTLHHSFSYRGPDFGMLRLVEKTELFLSPMMLVAQTLNHVVFGVEGVCHLSKGHVC